MQGLATLRTCEFVEKHVKQMSVSKDHANRLSVNTNISV